MATTFSDLGSVAGMKKLDDYLSTHRYITGAMSGESAGVTIEGSSSVEAVADEKSAAADEDDDDVDLFGGETEEEKKAAEERAVTSKASSKKESGKSSILLDAKPRDDETDMKKLEETVRGIRIEGLLWGASMLSRVDISLIYHMIRGRGTIKLYVAYSVLEIFD